MTQLWKVLAACTLVSPLVLGAQEPAAPASEHAQHEQHVAPAPEKGAEGQRLMQEHMRSMQRHMDMMDAMQGDKPAASPGRCTEDEAPALTR